MNEMDIASVDLNLFKVFEALYQEGSASRAGVRLDLSQSAVSAALGRLRTLFGDPLFTRTGHGLSPSLRASDLYPLVQEALEKCRQSIDLAAAPARGYAGRSVVMGLSDDFEIAVGQRLVEAIAQAMPGLRLIFRQTHSQVVGDMLQERQLDLAIASGGFTKRTLGREAFGEGTYACLVDAHSIRAGQVALDLDEFLARQHILVSAGGFVGLVDELLRALKRKRQVQASTTHFSALPYLLQGGSAVATLPLHAARSMAAGGGLAMLACPLAMPHYPVELGWRLDSLRNPVMLQAKGIAARVLQGYSWQ